jgi:hypothetical protein
MVDTIKLNIFIPLELEKKARDNAYNLGMARDGVGTVGPYILKLIREDLNEKNELDTSNIKGVDYTKTKRISLNFPKSYKDEVDRRAERLGFVWGGKGNISMYIRYLLTVC